MLNEKAAIHINKASRESRYKNFISLVTDPDRRNIFIAEAGDSLLLWQDDFFVPKSFSSEHLLFDREIKVVQIDLIAFLKKYEGTDISFFIHPNQTDIGLEITFIMLKKSLLNEMRYFSDIYSDELKQMCVQHD